MKISFRLASCSRSLTVVADTEVNAAVFMGACALNNGGGGYSPRILRDKDEKTGQVTFRVVEKYTDGEWPLAKAWMDLAWYMFRGEFETSKEFEREVNRRCRDRSDRGEFDSPNYFTVEETPAETAQCS